MKKLSRYLFRELVTYFFCCLFGMISLFLVFIGIVEASKIQNETRSFIELFSTILRRVPLLVDFVHPLSVLIASILTLVNFSKSSEFAAMNAAGLGLSFVMRTVIMFSIAIMIFSYINQSYLIHWFDSENQILISSNNLWKIRTGNLFHFQNVKHSEKKASKLMVLFFDQNQNIIRRIDLQNLFPKNNKWNSDAYIIRNFQGDQQTFQSMNRSPLFIHTLPEFYKMEEINLLFRPFSTSINELQSRIEAGAEINSVIFVLYRKLANLISAPVMFLLAVPFCMFSARNPNISFGIIFSVLLGITLWLSEQIVSALGNINTIPLILNTFGPNLLFATLGILFLIVKNRN